MRNAEYHANVLIRTFFSFPWALLRVGYRKPLEMTDIDELYPKDDVALSVARMEKALVGHRPFRAAALSVKGALARSAICRIIGDLLGFIPALLIPLLIDVVSGATAQRFAGEAYVLACVIAAGGLAQTLLLHQHHLIVIRAGMRISSATVYLLQQKLFRLREESAEQSLANLVAADAHKLGHAFWFIHYLWSSPIQIILTGALLYVYLGVAGVIGCCLMVALAPVQAAIAKGTAKLSATKMARADERLNELATLLEGVRVIKFYALERFFARRVSLRRARELRQLLELAALRAINVTLLAAGPLLVSIVSFGVYVALAAGDAALTTGRVLGALSLFYVLRLPLLVFPMALNSAVQANVSARRLRAFYELAELKIERPAAVPTPTSKKKRQKKELVFKLQQALFERRATFDDIELRRGELLVVAGGVGAGKSSLLRALLGELALVSGRATLPPRAELIAYVGQSPWILNSTLRDNIILESLGAPAADEARYAEALRVTHLRADVAALADGDATLVGERGVQLSGGQQQRLALARVVYAHDAKIVLLDAPTSALDEAVARGVWRDCVLGALADRTRVVCTNDLRCAETADRVVLLKDMSVKFSSRRSQSEAAMRRRLGVVSPSRRRARLLDSSSAAGAIDVDGGAAATTSAAARDEGAERREQGVIRLSVWLAYLRAGSPVLILLFVLSFGAAYGVALWHDIFIVDWASSSDDGGGDDGGGDGGGHDDWRQRLLAYALIGLGASVAFLVSRLFAAAFGYLASRRTHDAALRQITHARMRFFDVTPVGRVQNRFAKDTATLDDELPDTIYRTCDSVLQFCTVVVMMALSNALLLLVFVPVVAVYYFVFTFFRASSRELQRLESMAKSPVLAQFADMRAADALTAIRGYRLQSLFARELARRLNEHQRVFIALHNVNRWLGVRLEALGALVLLAAALAAAASGGGGGVEATSAALTGLGVVYAVRITHSLNWLVRSTLDLEMQMASTERVNELAAVEVERDAATRDAEEAAEEAAAAAEVAQQRRWPKLTLPPPSYVIARGELRFEKVSVRYAPHLPLVLDGASFAVRAGEKVGLVGRTGAGKSTSFLSLFGMIDVDAGAISIDGRDIRTIPLRQLRRALAIVPQQAHVFANETIRFNLAPGAAAVAAAVADDELWRMLRTVQLANRVTAIGGLDERAGAALSAGEAQLLCLARALLKRPRLLVLDEATSSVDVRTEELLWAAIESECAKTTILAIAHRPEALRLTTRTLRIEHGKIKEEAKKRKKKSAKVKK